MSGNKTKEIKMLKYLIWECKYKIFFFFMQTFAMQ